MVSLTNIRSFDFKDLHAFILGYHGAMGTSHFGHRIVVLHLIHIIRECVCVLHGLDFMAQDRDSWRALVNAIMNFRVP